MVLGKRSTDVWPADQPRKFFRPIRCPQDEFWQFLRPLLMQKTKADGSPDQQAEDLMFSEARMLLAAGGAGGAGEPPPAAAPAAAGVGVAEVKVEEKKAPAPAT